MSSFIANWALRKFSFFFLVSVSWNNKIFRYQRSTRLLGPAGLSVEPIDSALNAVRQVEAMTIECSPFLSALLQVKLQEVGIVTYSQLSQLISSFDASKGSEALQTAIPTLTESEASWVMECQSFMAPENFKLRAGHFGHAGLGFSIQSYADRMKEERARNRQGGTSATTFCRSLDGLLGGSGPQRGEVTEVCGPPGVGKTQLLMQLAVSCTLPVVFGGLGGSCIFLDTEGSFSAVRFRQMVSAAVSRVTSISSSLEPSAPHVKSNRKRQRGHSAAITSCADFTDESIMQAVHYCRVSDSCGLLACLHGLPDMIGNIESKEDSTNGNDTSTSSKAAYRKVKMVLLDSVSMPFRSLLDSGLSSTGMTVSVGGGGGAERKESISKRSKLMFTCSQLLHQAAVQNNLVVVISNHMSVMPSKILTKAPTATGTHQQLVPNNFDVLCHSVSTRVVLSYHHHHDLNSEAADTNSCAERDDSRGYEHRVARVLRNSTQTFVEGCFAISKKGIRDWCAKGSSAPS